MSGGDGAWVEATAVVANAQHNPVLIAVEGDAYLGGLCMFDDIVERFLGDTMEGDGYIFRQRALSINNQRNWGACSGLGRLNQGLQELV